MLKPTVAFALTALLAGCSLFAEEGLNRTFALPVVDLDAPETAAVGEPFTVFVTARLTSTCTTLERTDVDAQGDRLLIDLVGRERVRPGDECAASAEEVEARVEHAARAAGIVVVVANGSAGLVADTVRVE